MGLYRGCVPGWGKQGSALPHPEAARFLGVTVALSLVPWCGVNPSCSAALATLQVLLAIAQGTKDLAPLCL